jgi:hypothetical protein
MKKVSDLVVAYCEGRTREVLFPNSNIPSTLVFEKCLENY